MKKSAPRVSIVSPIYNDIATLPVILPRLVSLARRSFAKIECVLIDDASSDGSRQWVQSFKKKHQMIRLITHTTNQGIAKTYRELYASATGDIIVLFSMDGGWDPIDAIRLARTMEKGSCDMVIGVRRKKQYTLVRALISRLYNALTQLCFGVKTGDAGSIKAIRKTLIDRVSIISHGVFDEAERIIRAKKLGYVIGFLPVTHQKIHAKRKGIRLTHVAEAVVDAVRVFIHLTFFV